MPRLILRRLAITVLALVVVNCLAFTYALVARHVQLGLNPYGSSEAGQPPPVLALYSDYVRGVLRGDFGDLPVGSDTVAAAVARTAGASLGLLGAAFSCSVIVGLILGLAAVQAETGWIRRWLVPLSTLGLAMPSYFVGALLTFGLVFVMLRRGEGAQPLLPLGGFGWDLHLVLPVLALMVRPSMQIASLTASLVADEFGQPYIVAARSRGNSWRRIQWRHALRTALSPVVLTIAGSLRLLIAELIVVEWLFAWPGLGRLLAFALIAPRIAGPGGIETHYFLDPPLVAAVLTTFTLLFLLVDTVALALSRALDPRLQVAEVARHA